MPFLPRTSIARSSAWLVPCSQYTRSIIPLRHIPVINGSTIAIKRFHGASVRPAKRRVDAIIRPEWHPARTRTEFKARQTSPERNGMTPEEIRAAFSSVPSRKQGARPTREEGRGQSRTSFNNGGTVAGKRSHPNDTSSKRRVDDARQPEWLSGPSASRFNQHRKDRFSEDTRTSHSVPLREKEVQKMQEEKRPRSRISIKSNSTIAGEPSQRHDTSSEPNADKLAIQTRDIARAQEEASIKSRFYESRCKFCCKPINQHHTQCTPPPTYTHTQSSKVHFNGL
jgi:hypothetical protein